ncbi:MAG: family 16 glycosylhydrolase [Verrucomicrobiales bacterium]|nr:family 16 glycosylhydrolase [Verrucomicrobiales bacterium]
MSQRAGLFSPVLAVLFTASACLAEETADGKKSQVKSEAADETTPVAKDETTPEWLPEGKWALDWSDEFSGEGELEKWYPLLGYNPPAFKKNEAKGIRWSGKTEESSHMYSVKSGHHWLNGDGQLVMRIVTDKTKKNEHGPRVEAAYLLTGYPEVWDKTEPNNAKWAGKFVSPKDGPLYISARVRTDQVVGWSTWFAFWLFSETRAYNGNPVDGTEVDMIEIPRGKHEYMDKVFNVANHWKSTGGSESLQFREKGTPPSTSFVDVTDSDYHTYGIEWSKESMKCSVDGKVYYTFAENIPTDPVDMMMFLTLEFKPNAWDPNQGDGRVEGPYVSDSPEMREMSRALVDFVRVYRKE